MLKIKKGEYVMFNMLRCGKWNEKEVEVTFGKIKEISKFQFVTAHFLDIFI